MAARIDGTATWPPRPPVRTSRTIFLHHHQVEYLGHQAGGQHVPDAFVLAVEKLLSPSFPRLLRRITLRCLALDEARHHGLTDADPTTLAGPFRGRRQLAFDVAYRAWLDRHYLSHDDLLISLQERDLEDRLLERYRRLHPELPGRAALYRRIVADVAGRVGAAQQALTRPLLMRPGVPWEGPLLRELKLRGRFGPALELAGRVLSQNAGFLEQHPTFRLARIPRDRVAAWFAHQWHVGGADLDAAIQDHGFSSRLQFFEAGRPVYLYQRFGRPILSKLASPIVNDA